MKQTKQSEPMSFDLSIVLELLVHGHSLDIGVVKLISCKPRASGGHFETVEKRLPEIKKMISGTLFVSIGAGMAQLCLEF